MTTELLTAATTAQEMIDRLAAIAATELASQGLSRHDRFGYEADAKLPACHAAIVTSGWTVEHSTQGSVYYTRTGSDFRHRGKVQRMRLSNHEVPATAERDAAGFTWAKHGYQITTNTNSLEQCLQDIADFSEDFE
jgi:hypothetical protein